MNWGEFLYKFADQTLFHSSMLQVFQESQAYLRVQLSRWVDAEKLIQIRRGWYMIADPYRSQTIPPAVIANRVVAPSYLSMEWTLSYYGMIPEATPNPTSVTTARAEDFQASGRFFIYRHIKPSYFKGYSRIKYDGHEILIASPEKALWDKLYLYLRGRSFSIRWLEGLRLQNLEDFELSRWEAYTMMTPLASLHKASSQVAEYIQEIRR